MDMPVTIGNVHNVLLENIYDGQLHLVRAVSDLEHMPYIYVLAVVWLE